MQLPAPSHANPFGHPQHESAQHAMPLHAPLAHGTGMPGDQQPSGPWMHVRRSVPFVLHFVWPCMQVLVQQAPW
jgi:hypothetical protein